MALIKFRQKEFSTTTELLNSLEKVKVKSIDVIKATDTYLSVSMLELSKKEVKSYLDNGFKITEIGNKRTILVFNGEN